ncbi:unnamed protein product [Triticum turgidum subsp. durum]|uniref:Uncharacterized protein n=1 Tax=Triticum turgidum subsp. durum TaxID=4567 RepID=A0A9R0XQW1_TRITD|nr:unnamed protein product [Triticum turgidum subsp. durum]
MARKIGEVHDGHTTQSNDRSQARNRRARDVEFGISNSNRSTLGGNSSDDQHGIETPQTKKKYIQRLTRHQSYILEGFFGICEHPDENQRRRLSESTGLAMQQVKCWFQNKRTQVKHLTEKEESYGLKVQNEMLRDENKSLKMAQRNALCPTCIDLPIENHHSREMRLLKEQNEWLKQEILRLHGEKDASSNHCAQVDPYAKTIVALQNDIDMITELVQKALHEFVILSNINSPLWLSVPVLDGSFEILNKMKYAEKFGGDNSASIIGFKTEATRANAIVMMDAKNIVDYLMDTECCASLCPGILYSAKTTKVYKWPTNADYNGAMYLMKTETMFPSSLVPSRKCTFVRYCRVIQNGKVAIVDVSLDDVHGTFSNCRKMPSGVLIQTMGPNTCKITAIEHVQVEDMGINELYQPCISGLMFGARRIVTSIARQCARMRELCYVTKRVLSANSKGRETLMKLADDLLMSYTSSITTIPEDAWTIMCSVGTDDYIKIAYKRNINNRNTAIVFVSASFHLPMPLRVTFDLLKNNLLRPKWDVLVNGGVVGEEVQVSSGIQPGDAISLLHVKPVTQIKENIMILQNSCYDVSGSFIVYSPIDIKLMDNIMIPNDMEESKVFTYPTSFSLLPVDESTEDGIALGEDGATLVTMGSHVPLKLAHGTGLCPRFVSATIGIMSENITAIKRTLTNINPMYYRSSQSPILT